MSGPVLITGAAGSIGTMLRARLPGHGWTLRTFDRSGDPDVVGDVTDAAALDSAMPGVTAVVHLAGMPTEAPWAVIREANIEGTVQVFEAARRHGVRRVVYASSNHAAGFTPRAAALPADVPVRPDTLYGVSKAFGEALGRYYVDRYGFQVVSLRIGTCADRPTSVRALSTWLSTDDCGRLVDAALRAPVDYAVVWGVSDNRRNWWSLAEGRVIGYEPSDDAERFAASVEDGPDWDVVGGEYTGPDYGVQER